MPDPRFVVDEASFDFNGFDANEITDSLQALTNELACLRSDGETASVLSGWGAIICVGQTDVASLLTDHLLVARDLGARLLSLLDKCTAWDDSCAEIVEPAVVVEGTPLESFGIAWVVQQQQAGRATAVVTLKHRPYRGAFSVTNQSANSNVHFVVEPQDHPSFFRSVYSVENVPEREFFSVASLAFPNLDFAEGLSFGRFDGTYANLKIVVPRRCSSGKSAVSGDQCPHRG